MKVFSHNQCISILIKGLHIGQVTHRGKFFLGIQRNCSQERRGVIRRNIFFKCFSVFPFIRDYLAIFHGDHTPGFFDHPGIMGGEDKGNTFLPV